MLRPRVSRPVCFGTKHPFGAYDQILIIVWQLRVCYFLNLLSLITPRHGPHRKQLFHCCPNHLNGKCMPVKASPSNGRVYLLIKNLLPCSECRFVVCFEVATQQRLYTLQYLYSRNLYCTFPFYHDVVTRIIILCRKLIRCILEQHFVIEISSF
jgi:hypothetical protein